MTLEEKIRAYKDIRKKVEELDSERKLLVQEILQLMPKEEKVIRVAEYQVKRIVRLSIGTSLENAKLFGAIKMVEVVDKEKIKSLFELGHPVPDVSETQFIQVSIPKSSLDK